MSPKLFLARYWQKHPLLIRQAFADFEPPIDANDLAGLACESIANSRLVLHDAPNDQWQVRFGPFAESDFSQLPKSHWTLLVQDCDKAFAEVDALRDAFRFVPDWRVDDVMVSYAADGGSVGAHVDQYDVFLLQGHGRRRWQISTDPKAPLGFRGDVELKLLQQFTATHEWILEPGDMLYLPPNIAHHGVAIGECTTFSIGMRAPAVSELLIEFAEAAAERLGDDWRYSDPELQPTRAAGEVDAAAIEKVAHLLRQAVSVDPRIFADWYLRFTTRYRAAHDPVAREKPMTEAAIRKRVAAGALLHRNPWSRYAWRRDGRGAALYLAGQRFDASLACARTLAAARQYDAQALAALRPDDWPVLTAIFNAGHLVLSNDR